MNILMNSSKGCEPDEDNVDEENDERGQDTAQQPDCYTYLEIWIQDYVCIVREIRYRNSITNYS